MWIIFLQFNGARMRETYEATVFCSLPNKKYVRGKKSLKLEVMGPSILISVIKFEQ